MRGEGERTRKKERKGRKTLPGSLENRFNLIGHRLSRPFSCGVRTGGTILSLTEKTIDGLETSGERGVKNAVSLARRPDTRCFSPGYRRDRGHSRYVQQSQLKNSRNVLRRSSDPLGSSSGMHSHAPPRLSNVSAFRMTSVKKFLVERRVADSASFACTDPPSRTECVASVAKRNVKRSRTFRSCFWKESFVTECTRRLADECRLISTWFF